MMDSIMNNAMEILSISFSGISLGSILFLAIYVILQARKNRKEISLNKHQVEEAFKNAVLPSKMKIDISNKIEKPIKDGFTAIKEQVTERLDEVDHLLTLVLSVLAQFSHCEKLPEETRQEINDLVRKVEEAEVTV